MAVAAFLTSGNVMLLVAYAGAAVAFMMLFLQGDVLYNAFVANKVALGHLNVYSYFSSTPALQPIDTVMPPLYYLVTGLYLKLLMLIHLDPVTTNPNDLYTTVFGHHSGFVFALGLLLLKIPNLIAMLLGLGLSLRLARETGADPRVVRLLWIASPVLISTALMQAQNDAIPAVITLAALVAFRSKSGAWMMVLIGVAACFKSYALVLIPVTALLLSNRSLLTAVRYGILGLIPPIVVALPFFDKDFLQRVFFAHDGGTLYASSYIGRMPTHLWPIGYVGILVMAWILSRRKLDVLDVVAMWFLTLGLIFVINWWVPQWVVWLLPMVIIFAARDRIFAWTWVVAVAAVLANNLFNIPENMDGAMLMPIYGDHHHPPLSHYYGYHLYLLYRNVPYDIRDGAYILTGVAFLALCVRAVQWLMDRQRIIDWENRASLPSAALASLAGPLLLVPYIATMVFQRVVG